MSASDPNSDDDPGLEVFSARALDFAAVRGLFERLAFTSLGRRGLRRLAPRDEAGARAALARVEEMIAAPAGRPSLAGVSDPLPALEAVRRFGRPFEREELEDLRRFLGASLALAEWARDHREASPRCAELFRDPPPLAPLRDAIERTVDERGQVRDEATPRLAEVRRAIAALEPQIERTMARLAAAHAGVLSDLQVHRRGGRPCLAVKARSAGRVRGLVHDRSQSEASVFVEPEEVLEPGNRLAELRADARREEQVALARLTRDLLAGEEALLRASDAALELELARIGAAAAEALGARVPRLSEAGLVLRGARHPLLVDQAARGELEEVVPVDLRLGEEFDLLVITGPNTGGKTLALKTAGLAALLTRLGLPFPCEPGTTVPLYEGVAADIGDEQEVNQSLSTFSSHLVRIRRGLERAGPRTLVLLDELGGGTDPDEGAALGEAVLEELLRRGAPTIATTHLGVLKEFAFRRPRVENASAEFDVDTLRPRYRLVLGTPGESCALVIAARLGLPARVVDAARARLVRPSGEVTRLFAEVREAREEAERLRGRADERLEELERQRDDLERERERVDRRGEVLEAEAQRGLEERVRDARRELERAGALLAQLPGEAARSLGDVLAAADRELQGAALSERRQRFLDGLRKGDFVYLPRYRKRCAVTRVDRGRQEVVVRLGPGTLSVPFDEVTWYESL